MGQVADQSGIKEVVQFEITVQFSLRHPDGHWIAGKDLPA